MHGLKHKYSAKLLATKASEKQLEKVFETLMSGLKDGNKYIHCLYAESLVVISAKLNEKQLENAINTLIDGLKDEDKNVRNSYARSLGVISKKLDEKKLENTINTLIDGLKDKDRDVRMSCAESLGVISTNLTDKQLEGIFNALPNDLEWYYLHSYFNALEEISTKWNEKQSERVFNALTFVSKHSINTNNDEYKDRRLVRLLELSTKLNDKQLYLLVIHLLERAKKGFTRSVKDALPKISADMWKRATICGLKENIQMKNENTLMNKQNSNNRVLKAANNIDFELLAFGLMTFIPCIQLSCNDNNTNFDDLNELIRYCDKQAIKWEFPTHQSKWTNDNNYNDIQYPCLNDEIEK
ncbi:hypothetical protein RFI_40116, partial [Reticulomyxa filosa]